MSTAVGVEAGPVSHSHDVMATPSDSMHCLASPPWGGEAGLSGDTTSGLMVTKLLTRPKTSSSVYRASLQYTHGSACAIQVLGEKLSHPHSQPQPQPQERPKTSMTRNKEKGVASSRGLVVVPGKELALPICTTRQNRASGTGKEILSITTKLRNKSAAAAGSRGVTPLSGTTVREKSAALLKELTLSLSLSHREGPASPFKDCLREQWRSISREDPSLADTAAELSPSSFTPVPIQDYSEVDKYALPTDRFRSSNYLLDINETPVIRSSSPTKHYGELTRRSSFPVKESRNRSPRKTPVKRVQSTGNVLTDFGGGGSNDSSTPSKKDAAQKPEKEVVPKSPKIITINRLPSPTHPKESRSKPREKADSGSKLAPKSGLPSPTAATFQQSDTRLQPHTGKEVLAEFPSPGEAPCQVTTFDMAITPLKETLPSPRPRVASFMSDAGHPVSVRDDAVLTKYSLNGHQPLAVLHGECSETPQGRTDSTSPGRHCGRLENVVVGRLQEDGADHGHFGVGVKNSKHLADDPESVAREGPSAPGPIFVSPRHPEETETDGEAVKLLSGHSDSQTIHVPRRSDSSSSSSVR